MRIFEAVRSDIALLNSASMQVIEDKKCRIPASVLQVFICWEGQMQFHLLDLLLKLHAGFEAWYCSSTEHTSSVYSGVCLCICFMDMKLRIH